MLKNLPVMFHVYWVTSETLQAYYWIIWDDDSPGVQENIQQVTEAKRFKSQEKCKYMKNYESIGVPVVYSYMHFS